MPNLNAEQILESISKTTSEINDLLAKSGYSDLQKDGPAPEDEMAHGEPDGDEGTPPPAPEAEGAAPAPEGAEAPEAPEGAEGAEGDDMQAMEAHAKELSDEELDMMLQILTQEKEGRSAQQSPEMAPEAAAPAMPPAEKSMKEDFSKLNKSMETVLESINKLSQEVETLKNAKPAPVKTASKALPSNKMQVLEKSASATKTEGKKDRLNKSDSIEFVMGQIRKGNRELDVRVVSDLHHASSQEEVNAIQDALRLKGVSFPV